MKVHCTVDETELENDSGYPIEGVVVTCGRCGYEVESFGTSDASVKRCFALLHNGCPNNENNYYTE